MALFHDDGRAATRPGSTKMRPKAAAIAPAVCRITVPDACYQGVAIPLKIEIKNVSNRNRYLVEEFSHLYTEFARLQCADRRGDVVEFARVRVPCEPIEKREVTGFVDTRPAHRNAHRHKPGPREPFGQWRDECVILEALEPVHDQHGGLPFGRRSGPYVDQHLAQRAGNGVTGQRGSGHAGK
jgi:hypothetical protein